MPSVDENSRAGIKKLLAVFVALCCSKLCSKLKLLKSFTEVSDCTSRQMKDV